MKIFDRPDKIYIYETDYSMGPYARVSDDDIDEPIATINVKKGDGLIFVGTPEEYYISLCDRALAAFKRDETEIEE